jgi:hypothetical protein
MNSQEIVNKIYPRNLTAQAAYNVPGNPPITRLESGVGNCYPGLEYDHRNLDRRFFPGLVIEYVSQGDPSTAQAFRQGARVVSVDMVDPELFSPPTAFKNLAPALTSALSKASNQNPNALGGTATWFVSAIEQDGRTIEMVDAKGVFLDGLVVWRLVRGLRPDKVTLTLALRTADGTPGAKTSAAANTPPIILEGWRRRYTDPKSGVIDLAYRPGELTQSLCSPWMHDFRDCACTYWASNHPDIVFPAAPLGEPALPAGFPEDPLRANARIDWLRDRRSWPLAALSSPTQGGNLPFEISHFEINGRWQELSVVLEDRELEGLYVSRSQRAEYARPFETTQELRDQLIVLAQLEHLVALLYLYALYSLIDRSEAEQKAAATGKWPTLSDDVEFSRHEILEVAVSEMQHLRWANHILWGLFQTGMIPGWEYEPEVLRPALVIPGAGRVPTQPAKLAPLTPETLQLFVEIEEASGYIDGRYARVTSTLTQRQYPTTLYQLASNIVQEGEQHFLRFRDIRLVLGSYGSDVNDLPYLRPIQPGDPTDPAVKTALDTYQKITQALYLGYQLGDRQNQRAIAEARNLMFVLNDQAETLAKRNLGVPFLSLFLDGGGVK